MIRQEPAEAAALMMVSTDPLLVAGAAGRRVGRIDGMAFEGGLVASERLQQVVGDLVLAFFAVEVFFLFDVGQETHFDEDAGHAGSLKDADALIPLEHPLL